MMRLEKYLADAGVSSRRGAKSLIQSGRASVNGKSVTIPGTNIDENHDDIRVDGKVVVPTSVSHYYILNKPPGYLCTAHDPRGRHTVFELLPQSTERLFTVGRLDRDVEGLLLVTNDGDLAFRLSHPRFEIGKTYVADVDGTATPARMARLSSGVTIEGRETCAAEVTALRVGSERSTIRLTIHEGRKHQVKLMCDAVGLPVRALRRVSMGPLRLTGLPPGAYRPLSSVELRALRGAVGL